MLNIYASMMRVAARLETSQSDAPVFEMTECRSRIESYAQLVRSN
jgi:hypothetical protein